MVEIKNYSKTMTISQVVVFFDRIDIHFTKTMIQNYVRIGLLPPPSDKRHYGHGHLHLLWLIHFFKENFSLEEIRGLFAATLGPAYATAEVCGEDAEALYVQATSMQEHEENETAPILSLMCRSVLLKRKAKRMLDDE